MFSEVEPFFSSVAVMYLRPVGCLNILTNCTIFFLNGQRDIKPILFWVVQDRYLRIQSCTIHAEVIALEILRIQSGLLVLYLIKMSVIRTSLFICFLKQ